METNCILGPLKGIVISNYHSGNAHYLLLIILIGKAMDLAHTVHTVLGAGTSEQALCVKPGNLTNMALEKFVMHNSKEGQGEHFSHMDLPCSLWI